MKTLWLTLMLWAATAFQIGAAIQSVRRSIRCRAEWQRLRAMNQIVWAYATELKNKGVTLPPRCVMCCQILPQHVDGCLMVDAHEKMERQLKFARIKYYRKGEHAPHPEEEPPDA